MQAKEVVWWRRLQTMRYSWYGSTMHWLVLRWKHFSIQSNLEIVLKLVDPIWTGKTDCSVCHSTNGVLCRGCLKVRYGEGESFVGDIRIPITWIRWRRESVRSLTRCIALLEMEEVRENKEWMCPHCIEEKGVKPYWICNRYGHDNIHLLIQLYVLMMTGDLIFFFWPWMK